MNDLPMPSDLKGSPTAPANAPAAGSEPLVEPPSVKLVVRLFLIPFFIVAAAVGVMFLIGRLAGGTPSFDEALTRLKNPGGERTVDMLVGPGSKQRYMDAKTVADKIMKLGTNPAERVKISDELIDVLDHYTSDAEGDVRHFLLLALGRSWQFDQPGATEDSKQTQMAALAYVDRWLGVLFDALRQRGSTLCVICSDHGTAYGEDGFVGHRIAHSVVWDVPYAQFMLEGVAS